MVLKLLLPISRKAKAMWLFLLGFVTGVALTAAIVYFFILPAAYVAGTQDGNGHG